MMNELFVIYLRRFVAGGVYYTLLIILSHPYYEKNISPQAGIVERQQQSAYEVGPSATQDAAQRKEEATPSQCALSVVSRYQVDIFL